MAKRGRGEMKNDKNGLFVLEKKIKIRVATTWSFYSGDINDAFSDLSI